MTPSRMLRPVLVCLALSAAGLTTASCGMMDSPNRFQSMAEKVADIPLDGRPAAPGRQNARGMGAEDLGLRPATSRQHPADDALRVEVMDPHDLWDARDGLRGAVRRETEAAAPVVARAVVQQAVARIETEATQLRPAIAREPAKAALVQARTTIQLGAYSSQEVARSAWARVSAGAAQAALTGLSPQYEAVEVNGRPLTRLKVSAPADTAVAICRAAQVTDPWCARRT